MQVMMKKISDKELLHLLAEDMFERNKKLRFDTITHQIEDIIVEKWLLSARKQHIWGKPVKCIVKFVLMGRAGVVIPGSGFALRISLDPQGESRLDNYVKQVRSALNKDMIFLHNNFDLDMLEFDGPDAIEVVEYHMDLN